MLCHGHMIVPFHCSNRSMKTLLSSTRVKDKTYNTRILQLKNLRHAHVRVCGHTHTHIHTLRTCAIAVFQVFEIKSVMCHVLYMSY